MTGSARTSLACLQPSCSTTCKDVSFLVWPLNYALGCVSSGRSLLQIWDGQTLANLPGELVRNLGVPRHGFNLPRLRVAP